MGWLAVGRWSSRLACALGGIAVLAGVATYVDWRDGRQQLAWCMRGAQGPWPKDRVAQAVIVPFPRSADVGSIEKELAEVLRKDDVGYFDGTECWRNRCSMFMYGPQAEALSEAVTPILKKNPLTSAATLYLRLGPARKDVVLLTKKL